MLKTQHSPIPPGSEKHHYHILDGLRGVAAIVVVWFHIFEAYATSHVDQIINHGYLAVDFFFMLSGFVIGYAYDNRWKTMTTREFIKRRLIRLQPMVAIGALIGALIFYFQGCPVWDVSQVAVISLFAATFVNILLIPSPPGMEIRVWEKCTRSTARAGPCSLNTSVTFFMPSSSENSPHVPWQYWLSRRMRPCLLQLLGPQRGHMLRILHDRHGMDGRLPAPVVLLLLGLLLFRLFKPFNVKNFFWLCSLSLAILLAVPRLGGQNAFWMNSLYETACFAVFFPLILLFGASGKITNPYTDKICRFLGNISYPLYMVHYPFIYLVLCVGEKRKAFLPGPTSRSPGRRHWKHSSGLALPETL